MTMQFKMSINTKSLYRLICGLSLVLTVSSSILYSQNSPNVVIIMADDLGYYDVGFNRIHSPNVSTYGVIPTPQVDRIAQQGITCTRGYVAHPFCGPSRAALLTGRYPHEVGSQYNLQNNAVDCNNNDVGVPVGADSEFFSKALQQQANYDTYMVGKWHVGDTQMYDPLSRGFDEYWGFLGGGHQYFPEGDPSQGYNSTNAIAANRNNVGINDYFKYIEKNRQWLTNESRYVTRGISEEAVNFIKQGKQSNDPFLVYVSYNAPHTPIQAPLPDINQFKADNPNFEALVANSPDILNARAVVEATTQAERDAAIANLVEKRVTYAAMVTIMDEGIGQILDELQSNADGGSVFDNTIVMFLSDNGGKLREGGGANYPLDLGKGAVNEGGFRVPMTVSWPNGGFQANSTYVHPVSSLDIYPTLLGAAGLAIPNRLDGEDVSSYLASNSPVLRNDPLYILRHYNGFSNVSILDNIAGSNDKVIKKANGDWQHFNVDSDISETTNLGSQTIINRLVSKVKILAEQHIQPLFFDNCGNVFNNWNTKDMPRYKDASGRPNPPDETLFLNCQGNTQDSDNDGVCDGLDLCPGSDDTIDMNANGIPDGCESCDPALNGTACNDNNACTTGDVFDSNCNCAGTFADTDNDGVCDANDVCPGGDDAVDSDGDGTPDFCDTCDTALIGTSCNDNNACTTGDVYDSNCNCTGTFADADADGVCDAIDICPGGDDAQDADNNGTPDFCDTCNTNTTPVNAALAGVTSMSSTLGILAASRLNDDIINNLVLAHSGNSSPHEWMEIDLGSSQNVSDIVIWNRTTCCQYRLSNIYVMTSDTPFPQNTDLTAALANADFTLQLGNTSTLDDITVSVNQMARYVRLQKSGNNVNNDNNLNIKELQVFTIPSAACDDGDPCTVNDVIDQNCNCVGTFTDSDNDGVCDANDLCAGSDDSVDVDNDGTPDGCDNCTTSGQSCDDGDQCTVNDVYDQNCNCTGNFVDADNDGVCVGDDANDNDPCIPDNKLDPSCGAPSCTTVSNESFESALGIWNLGGNDASIILVNAKTGTSSARLRDDSGNASSIFTDALDLSSFSEGTISFSCFPSSMEAGEDFFLEYSINGGSYTTIQIWVSGTDFQNFTRFEANVSIPSTAISSATRFRLRCDASANNDRVFIDDLIIEMCSGAASFTQMNDASFGFIKDQSTTVIDGVSVAEIKIFPNPFLANISIEFQDASKRQPYQVSMYNSVGQQVFDSKQLIDKVFTIDIDEELSGIYFIYIRDESGELMVYEKLMKL